MLEKQIHQILKETFPDVQMDLRDSTGTGDHWELKIATEAFRGKNKVKQHQAVYGPLRALIDSNQVHALKLTTLLPEQWDEA